jgi:hypothetical protein
MGLIATDGGYSAVYAYPTGVFTASGVTQQTNNPLNDNNVRGGLIRVEWNQIETAPGTYDWQQLDSQIDTVECNAHCYSNGGSPGTCANDLTPRGGKAACVAKEFSLSVLGGPFAPTWLWSGANNLGVATFVANNQTIPKFWDATLQTRLSSLAAALGNRYGQDSSLKLVYLPQMTLNGVEGHFNGIPDATLTGAGYTVSDWVGAVEQATQAFAKSFPSTSIAIELHYMLASSCEGLRVMNDITANTGGFAGRADSANQQIGVATWWYGGAAMPNTSAYQEYQADLIFGTAFGDTQDEFGTAEPGDTSDTYGRACLHQSVQAGGFQGFAKAGGRIYAQVIQQSSICGGSSTCMDFPFGYSAIFTQAEALPINYMEVWQQDIGTTWETNLAAYNSATNGK